MLLFGAYSLAVDLGAEDPFANAFGILPGASLPAGPGFGPEPDNVFVAPIESRTADDLLGFFDRNLPSSYLGPIKRSGSGYEVFRSIAKVMERVSLAIGRTDNGLSVMRARGGARALVQIEFYRDSTSAGAGAQEKSTVVSTSRHDRRFVTRERAEFGALSLGPVQVLAEAIEEGYEYNVPGPKVAANGDAIPGEIDTIVSSAQSGDFWDASIKVRQVSDATGGRPSDLDAIGADRGIPRNPGENDAVYRERIRGLPDTVSPDAIIRTLQRILAPYGGVGEFIEPFDPEYQTAWDDIDGGDTFIFDSEEPFFPLTNRWLSWRELAAAFIVAIPRLPPIRDFGGNWDDEAVSLGELTFEQTGGTKAVFAWDLDLFDEEDVACWDGTDSGAEALYAGIWDTLQAIKPAGVDVGLVLEGN